MAKHIFSPIITKLSGLVDIGLIRVSPKFERKNDQKLTFFFHMHQIFGLLVNMLAPSSLTTPLPSIPVFGSCMKRPLNKTELLCKSKIIDVHNEMEANIAKS